MIKTTSSNEFKLGMLIDSNGYYLRKEWRPDDVFIIISS